VPRQDVELLLCGARIGELLLQTCSFDFASLDFAERPVVLTSMAGVGVTVLPVAIGAGPAYRIWCDITYGAWLWRTLTAIARELGGGPVGLDTLRQTEVLMDDLRRIDHPAAEHTGSMR